MKLPIKKVYFDQIKEGKKVVEYRDAHITFVCIETGETHKEEIAQSVVVSRPKGFHDDVMEDDWMLVMVFGKGDITKLQ